MNHITAKARCFLADPRRAVEELSQLIDRVFDVYILDSHEAPDDRVGSGHFREPTPCELQEMRLADELDNLADAFRLANRKTELFQSISVDILSDAAQTLRGAFTLNRTCVEGGRIRMPEGLGRLLAASDQELHHLNLVVDFELAERQIRSSAALEVPETPAAGSSDADNPWQTGDARIIRDLLKGQQLKLFDILWGQDRWTYFSELKHMRTERLWKGQPDPSDITDDRVFHALRTLQERWPAEVPHQLRIEEAARRVRVTQ
jgi:hypothetical protein